MPLVVELLGVGDLNVSSSARPLEYCFKNRLPRGNGVEDAEDDRVIKRTIRKVLRSLDPGPMLLHRSPELLTVWGLDSGDLMSSLRETVGEEPPVGAQVHHRPRLSHVGDKEL